MLHARVWIKHMDQHLRLTAKHDVSDLIAGSFKA